MNLSFASLATYWPLGVALLSGLLAGVLVVWLICRRLSANSLALQARDHEARLQGEQHKWQLQEQHWQYQCAQLQRQLDDARALQERADTQARQLDDSRQALAAAQEKLRQLDELKSAWQTSQQENTQLRKQQAELNTRLETERKNFAEQLSLLQTAKAELTREFENLANKIFEQKQQQFSLNSKSLLESTLDPFKLQLGEFRRKVEDVYEKENAERNRLAGQIVELQKQAQKIGEDAVNLAQALKGNSKTQGNWGEVVLERLLEQSGLQKGREYDTQLSFAGEDGSRRMPDVVVHLPEGKDLVIDAKVSLLDYEKYCNADDDAERIRHLAAHIGSLRSHIKGLSTKDYEKLEGIKALDFIFIFIPIEAAFMLALQEEPGLYREAYDRHIILVSPTTLLATLRTVENIWRYEKQNKNAERIAKEAGALHDQFVLLLAALDSVEKHLGQTRDAFTLARARLHTGRGNLVKRVNDIRKLGAKTKKAIDGQWLEAADEDVTDIELPEVDDALALDAPDDDAREE